MVARAHVLLQVDPGRSAEAVQYLSALDAVSEAVPTSGAYDVIATVQAMTPDALRSAVGQARHTPGLFALRWCWTASPGSGGAD